MAREHTDREYEAQLQTLKEQILLMGAKVEEMIAGSTRALVDRDNELAHRMIEQDQEVNRLEVESDELCLRVLARRQPVASDLRFITTALKLVTDLERIGDMAVNICERVIELNAEPPLEPYVDLPRMSAAAERMVHQALDAFVQGDADLALSVIEQDRTVDAYYGQIFRELLTHMTKDAQNIYRATRLQAIAKYLERVGDHATNLAEKVVFMLKGKDIRHLGRTDAAGAHHLPHGILFLCVHNAARSQMAEGWARKLLPTGVRVWSAGSSPAAEVHPRAIKAMREVGIDISDQRPKSIADVPMGDIDTAITLCAEEVCPRLPDVRRESWALPDPAAAGGTEQGIDDAFRRVRDELKERIERMAGASTGSARTGDR